ncbi:MAG: GTP cyclohydrolase I FolE [Planctomycetes bacterium]|nr:GTP cyclohydrolase I FolE [Planctomycetota bacterium]
MDTAKIERAVRMILEAVGEDPQREGLKETPRRVAKMYEEVFSGLGADVNRHFEAVFAEPYDEMVILRDIPFQSFCEHHLLPFIGRAHVAYVPQGRVIGISKLARIVQHFARRPQVQERLTDQVANIIMEKLEPRGVAVVMTAEHTCMTLRGVRTPGCTMTTSSVRGIFKENLATRAEVMSLLQH